MDIFGKGFFFLFSSTEKAKFSKTEFAVASIFSRLLIRKGKKKFPCNHLSLLFPLLCVTPPLWGALLLSHAHVGVLACSHTQKHTRKNKLYIHLHTYIHTFCTKWFCINFLVWSEVLLWGKPGKLENLKVWIHSGLIAHAWSNTLEVLELTEEFTYENTFPCITVFVAEGLAGCDSPHHSENNSKDIAWSHPSFMPQLLLKTKPIRAIQIKLFLT